MNIKVLLIAICIITLAGCPNTDKNQLSNLPQNICPDSFDGQYFILNEKKLSVNDSNQINWINENCKKFKDQSKELLSLPENTCPDNYDGKYFTLKGNKLGVDGPQIDWINENCEKFKTQKQSLSLPEGTCPDTYDGKNAFLNGLKLDLNNEESDWIYKNCDVVKIYFKNLENLKPLPAETCPDSYNENYFVLNEKNLSVDKIQADWITQNCDKFKPVIINDEISFDIISGAKPNGFVQEDRIANALAASPKNPDVVYVGTEGNGIFKSTDGGKNWRWLRTGLKHGRRCDTTQETYAKAYGIVINPLNDSIIYVAMTCGPENSNNSVGGVYKSIDGGETWTQKINGLPSAAIDSIALNMNNPDIIYVGTNGEKPSPKNEVLPGGIYKSTNAGESWTALYEKPNRFDKIVIKNNIMFASGLKWIDAGESKRIPDVNNSAGLIKSTDNGKTWTTISKEFITAFDVTQDGKIIYAATDEGIGYKSEDSGQSWKKIELNGPIRISPFDPQTFLYASIKKSTNGYSRDVFKTEKWISHVEYTSNPDIIYAGSPGYLIYKSVDGGETFSEIANLRKFIENN